MRDDALGWLTGETFSSIDGVPTLVLQHLGLSAASLVLALVLALPLGLYLAHKPPGTDPVHQRRQCLPGHSRLRPAARRLPDRWLLLSHCWCWSSH